MLVLNLPAFENKKNTQPMTVSMETVRMAEFWSKKNQLERSDLPYHIIIRFIIPLKSKIHEDYHRNNRKKNPLLYQPFSSEQLNGKRWCKDGSLIVTHDVKI